MFSRLFLLTSRIRMPNFYAVHAGRKTGVFKDWKTCQEQIIKFPNAKFKKFTTMIDAEKFVKFGFASLTDSVKDKSEKIVGRKRKSKGTEEVQDNKKQRSEDVEEILPIVYTDGACSNNQQQGSARAGYGIFWGDNHPLNLSCKLQGVQTNQRAEIAAINVAIKQALENGHNQMTICTDSMFAINCIVLWSPKWRKNGWRKADGKEVIHKKEFIEILDNLTKINVTWKHVRGHKGIYGNEMADKLAVAGIDKPL